MSISPGEQSDSDDERRFNELGLSSEVLHDGLRRGASRANNRSAQALLSSAGTDIYHDSMEDLHRILGSRGWYLEDINGQPRLIHPDGVVSFTVSSGVNVGEKKMRTRKKGPATEASLAQPVVVPSLFPDIDAALVAQLVARAARSPFFLLLVERATQGGSGLVLEFAEPAEMSDGKSVVAWGERIKIRFFDLDGDLSVFNGPDDGGDEFDVPVAPR